MTILLWIGSIISLALFAYLFAALLWPEKWL